MTTDLFQHLAERRGAGQSVEANDEKIHGQRVAAATELERIRALRHDEARSLIEAVKRADEAREAAWRVYRAAAAEFIDAVGRQYCASSAVAGQG